MTAPPPSRPEPSVPAREKLGLGLGFAASQGATNVVYVLSHQVLNVMFGLNPALVTLIGAAQRIWNALLDPVFGRLSDNLRGPLGRRRPLLLAAIVPLAASFVAMWWFPRGWGGLRLFAYSLAASLLLYTAISLYSSALGGLQVEAASGYHERTRVAAFMQLCFLAFTVAAQWVFPLIQGFADPVRGLRELALGAGLFFLAAGLAPVWLARDRLYAWVAARQGRLRFGERLRAARRNPPLLRLLAADGAMSLGFYLSSALGFYLNYYYIYAGDVKAAAVMQGVLGTAFQLAAFGSVVAFRQLSFRIGKRRAFQLAAACHFAGAAAKLWLFRPEHPSWQIFAYLASGAAYAATEMFSLSMLADVVDLDELRTGVRSEALHWSLLSWVDKLGGAAGTLLSGLLLVAVGFDSRLGGAQSARCLLLMRVLYAACPAGGALAAIALLARFPVTESSARAVRDELDLRRAAAAG
ncbi:MAG TPA: MFS transporter [Opitutaceae bacterium]|nr:MFS transporter [Opitutaceae bacterium]